jgi:hypothetical protein
VSSLSWAKWPGRALSVLILSLVFAFSSTLVAFANATLTKLSSDPYTNSTSQHASRV